MLNLFQHPALRLRGGWPAGPWTEFRVTVRCWRSRSSSNGSRSGKPLRRPPQSGHAELVSASSPPPPGRV